MCSRVGEKAVQQFQICQPPTSFQFQFNDCQEGKPAQHVEESQRETMPSYTIIQNG